MDEDDPAGIRRTSLILGLIDLLGFCQGNDGHINRNQHVQGPPRVLLKSCPASGKTSALQQLVRLLISSGIQVIVLVWLCLWMVPDIPPAQVAVLMAAGRNEWTSANFKSHAESQIYSWPDGRRVVDLLVVDDAQVGHVYSFPLHTCLKPCFSFASYFLPCSQKTYLKGDFLESVVKTCPVPVLLAASYSCDAVSDPSTPSVLRSCNIVEPTECFMSEQEVDEMLSLVKSPSPTISVSNKQAFIRLVKERTSLSTGRQVFCLLP